MSACTCYEISTHTYVRDRDTYLDHHGNQEVDKHHQVYSSHNNKSSRVHSNKSLVPTCGVGGKERGGGRRRGCDATRGDSAKSCTSSI